MNKINIYTFLFCTIFLAIGCYAQQASYPKSKILQKNFSSNLKDQLRELEKDSFVQYLNECREKWKNNPYRPIYHFLNPEKPDVPLNKNDAFQKVQKRRVQEKR